MKIYQVTSSNKVTNKEKKERKNDGFEEGNGRRRRHSHEN
jgi:hypothetical protein